MGAFATLASSMATQITPRQTALPGFREKISQISGITPYPRGSEWVQTTPVRHSGIPRRRLRLCDPCPLGRFSPFPGDVSMKKLGLLLLLAVFTAGVIGCGDKTEKTKTEAAKIQHAA